MKKLFLIGAFVLTALFASAQDSGNDYLPDGVLTVEWRFNPFDYEDKPKNMAQVNARLFLNEKHVVRLGVGVGYHRDKDENTTSKDTRNTDIKNYVAENSNKTTIDKETSLKIGLGYEYHFAYTGRLDMYAGVEAGYLGRFYSATQETKTNTTNVSTSGTTTQSTFTDFYNNLDYKKSNASRTKFNENGFYGSVFLGADFYVYKKLYVGAEMGICFNMAKKSNGTYTSDKGQVKTVDGTQTENWTEKYSSDTGATLRLDNISKTYKTTYDTVVENSGNNIRVYIEPAIRIGWMF